MKKYLSKKLWLKNDYYDFVVWLSRSNLDDRHFYLRCDYRNFCDLVDDFRLLGWTVEYEMY